MICNFLDVAGWITFADVKAFVEKVFFIFPVKTTVQSFPCLGKYLFSEFHLFFKNRNIISHQCHVQCAVDAGTGIPEAVCSIFFYEDGIGGIGRPIIFWAVRLSPK